MFSPSGRSFLMFGKQGRSWVGLFGPFGDPREFADMVWQFMEMATDHGGRAAFYHVRPASLPLFLDCGLHLFKLGEHAHVELPDFNLKGASRANLRSGVNRAEREGLRFEVVPAAGVDALLPELRRGVGRLARPSSAAARRRSPSAASTTTTCASCPWPSSVATTASWRSPTC